MSDVALSVVIPAYNEAARIGETLAATCKYLAGRGLSFEILVIDDGSQDSTAEVVRRIGDSDDRVQLFQLPENRGKGAAVRTGMLAARGQHVLFMDADLATPIEELEKLERALAPSSESATPNGPAARLAQVAIGSRGLPGSQILQRQHPVRQLLGKGFNLLVRTLALPEFRDTQCGFKLFTREAAQAIFAQSQVDRFAFDVEALLLCRDRFAVVEVPVRWRHVEQSKLSPLPDALRMAYDLLRLRLRLSRISRWDVLVPCAMLLLAGIVFAPALRYAQLFANRYDWRYFESMGEMSRRAVLWYGQAPLWNPYSCGGEVGFANPQSLDAAPTFALVLLFGTALGYKLSLVFYYFCAQFGTYLLARRFAMSRAASVLAGVGFGFCEYQALHLYMGHVAFLGIGLYPFLLLFFDRAQDDIEWVIPTGLCAAWIVALGGTFTPLLAAELLLLWACLHAAWGRTLRPFVRLLLSGLVALSAGAVRMLPTFQFIVDHPRPTFMRAVDHIWPGDVLRSLLLIRPIGPLPGLRYGSHEYGARLAYALLPLWAGSIALLFRPLTASRSLTRWLWLLALVFIGLSMGNFAPFAPWSLLQRLPVMRDLRVPSRHLVIVALCLTLLAGLTLDQIMAWLRARPTLGSSRLVRLLPCLLIATCIFDGAGLTARRFSVLFTDARVLPPGPVPFFQASGSWRHMREILFSGHGTIETPGSREVACEEEAPLQRAKQLDEGPVPQERLLDPTAGAVVHSRWTPNQRQITVELSAPTTLLINSNWNEHWHSDKGRVTKVEGRLAVDLSGLAIGRHEIRLRYAPTSFYVGAGLSALFLPSFLGLFFWRRRRRLSAGRSW